MSNYGSTSVGVDVDDSTPPKPRREEEKKPLRQAFSMDYGGDDAAASPAAASYARSMSLLSAYVLASTLFFGFCLGFSVSFWCSGAFWRSPLGLSKLGCADGARGGVAAVEDDCGGAAGRADPGDGDSAAAADPSDRDGGGGDDRDERSRRQDLLDLLPLGHLAHGADADREGWGSIYGPPLIDIAKKMKHRHKRKKDRNHTSAGDAATTVGTARPNVYLNHREAYDMLLDDAAGGAGGGVPPAVSEYSADYFLLTSGLDAQVNQDYCAVASAQALLNSLRFLHPRTEAGVDVPADAAYAPYAYVTQADVFGPCSRRSVVSRVGGGFGVDGILTYPYGLGMGQVAALLRCHLSAGAGWTVAERRPGGADGVSLPRMRDEVRDALADPNARVLVNYHRGTAGQVGGGHWSPVGSYSAGRDAFLIVDVAKYKYPPVWIPAERLYESLATYDECGTWDWPLAQDGLPEELRQPRTDEEEAEAARAVGCRRTQRGYVIARKG